MLLRSAVFSKTVVVVVVVVVKLIIKILIYILYNTVQYILN